MTTTANPPTAGLWTRGNATVAFGGTALVTLGAYADRATGTVLPRVAQDLHGLAWFGAAAAAPMISYVAATAWAGVRVDRKGPAAAILWAAILFVVAQFASAATGGMALFTVTRLLSGVSEAILDISVTVLVAQLLPSRLRAKVFAAFAVAWVAPSVVGPVLAGWLAETVGWRWSFVLTGLLMVPAIAVVAPALRRARPGGTVPPGSRQTVAGALGASLLLALLAWTGSLGWVLAFPPLLLALAITLRWTLPPGTLRAAPGPPAIIALRGLAAGGFASGSLFLGLLLVTLRGYTLAGAGVVLTLTAVFWAAGSWLNARDGVQRFAAVTRLRGAFALMAVGIAGTASLTATGVPALVGLAAWSLASLGIGIATPTLSVAMLDAAPVREQGRYQSGIYIASATATSVVGAVAGALLGATGPHGVTFTTILLIGAALAALGVAVANRPGKP